MIQTICQAENPIAPMSQQGFMLQIPHRIKKFMDGGLDSRFGGIYVFGVAFLLVSFLLRTILYFQSASDIDFHIFLFVKMYLTGFFYDLITCFYVVTPMAVLLVFIPDRWYRSQWNRIFSFGLYFIMLYLMLFDVASECFFWDEFGSRFNFIAVDYLVYTQEVVGNIWQSYSVPLVLGILLAAVLLILLGTRKFYFRTFSSTSSFSQRCRYGIIFLGISLSSLLFVDMSLGDISKNQYVNELARNGFYSLIDAFRNNTIDYHTFYIAKKENVVFPRLKELLGTGNSHYVTTNPFDITRDITYSGPEKHYNVVILVIESLSAQFLGVFGNQEGLTPNLDHLAQESLLFRNLYATGTRTTRGLEAITLSLPPTPGQSLVKRPHNSELFSIGPLFQQRDYENKFIYGGRGFFDNMNRFFAGNGFDTIDQTYFSDKEVTFQNAWGVCDGDLFDKTLAECDASYAQNRPFFNLVLSTSNHRPYTYPQVIDIPSGTGRNGAVKYTDYAIGEFMQKAKTRDWFANTLFVIVADHCASSAGKMEVPVEKYHIPLFMYAPQLIKPDPIDRLASQIDVAPTLLGLLHFSYRSKFFGQDILQMEMGRALLGNYQKVGLYCRGKLTLLLPKKQSSTYAIDPQNHQGETQEDPELLLDTISYYQGADYLLRNHLYMAN